MTIAAGPRRWQGRANPNALQSRYVQHIGLRGKELTAFGGFMPQSGRGEPLHANREPLERAARRWWKLRTEHLARFGHGPLASAIAQGRGSSW